MDGSQKLPQRLLGTLRWRLERWHACPALTLGVAGWMRYAMGRDEQGQPIDVRDPLSGRFTEIASRAGTDATRLVDEFLAIQAVFGTDLPEREDWRAALITAAVTGKIDVREAA